MNVSFDLLAGKLLQWKHSYSFFIRAWYGENNYQTFKSPGINILSKPPATTNIRGASVQEVVGSSMKDVDYVTSHTPVSVDWTNKFVGEDISKFHLYISTFPEGKLLVLTCSPSRYEIF